MGIVGFGVLGVASLLVARALGAPTAVASHRSSALARAVALGATAHDPVSDDHGWADIVIDTSNAWEDFRSATLFASKGGSVILLGFPGRGLPPPKFNPFEPQITYARQLAIIHGGETPDLPGPEHVVRFNLQRNMQYLMTLVAEGRLAADVLVSRREAAQDLARVYESMVATRGETLTVALEWPSPLSSC